MLVPGICVIFVPGLFIDLGGGGALLIDLGGLDGGGALLIDLGGLDGGGALLNDLGGLDGGGVVEGRFSYAFFFFFVSHF